MDVDIDELVGKMSLEEKIGQVVMGVHAPSWADAPDSERLIRECHIGSVISCGYRTFSAREVAQANNRLQDIALASGARVPLLNGGDFEQGVASQVPHDSTPFPMQMGIAATWDEEAAERVAEIAGQEARAMGFHWTFAPDCDVNNNPNNPVIGVRTFSDQPQIVSRLTRAQLRGYARANLLATPKHFPGHGDTAVDSHLGLPTVTCSAEEFRAVHLSPFVDAIAAGAPTLMTAHIVVPSLDPHLPATLSRAILTDLLRGELGFEGVVITDQMTMKSVANRWGVERASVMAFQAGSDVVLAGGDTALQISTVRALVEAARTGAISPAQLDTSVRRVLKLKQDCGIFAQPMVDVADASPSLAHREFADDLAARSITLLRNEGILPFDRAENVTTLVAGITNESIFGPTRASHVAPVASEIERVSGGTTIPWAAAGEDPSEREIDEALSLASGADRVIVLTYARGRLPAGQAALAERLAGLGKPTVAVAMGTPYDIVSYPQVPAYVAAFAQSFVPIHINAPNVVAALVRVLFGQSPQGRLPVEIPSLYPLGHGLGY